MDIKIIIYLKILCSKVTNDDAGCIQSVRIRSDKSSWHGYHRYYERHLAHLHDEDHFNLVEIGFYSGGSARAWLDIFKKENIDVLEIDETKATTDIDPRCVILIGDQSDPVALDDVVKTVGSTSLIIDDGSHLPSHQLYTFNMWFGTFLKPGGVYIIEDIETSYWTNGSMYKNTINCGINCEDNIVNIFSSILHQSVNREFMKHVSDEHRIPLEIQTQIESITFAYNCIIIHKKKNNDYDRDTYRFADCL